MKNLVVLFLALVTVSGVAVNASRAAPLSPAQSVAFTHCVGKSRHNIELDTRCVRTGPPYVLADHEVGAEFAGADVAAAAAAVGANTTGGNDVGDPDAPLAAAVLAVAVAAARAAGLAAAVAAGAELGRRAGDWVADRIFGQDNQRGGGAAQSVPTADLAMIFDPVR